MNWYLVALKKYSVFAGRARRKEYWTFQLWNVAIVTVLFVIDIATGTARPGVRNLGLLSSLFILAVFIPSIAVSVRRLHDTNRSGWWLLLNFVPIIGPIMILIFAVQDGQPGENRFGPNPKSEPIERSAV